MPRKKSAAKKAESKATEPTKKGDVKGSVMSSLCSRPLGVDAGTIALAIGRGGERGSVMAELNALGEKGYARRIGNIWQPTPKGMLENQNQPPAPPPVENPEPKSEG